MNPGLPAALTTALDRLLVGVSRKELAARSQAISAHYRSGHGSAAAVANFDDALAYVVARLPATYAVTAAVLDQLRAAAPGFGPDTLLDIGAGPGTASWAARAIWPTLNAILLDANPQFRSVAKLLAPAFEVRAANVLRDPLPHAGLVIASYVLAEIARPDLDGLVARLFEAAHDVLVLIEPGTPQGFERLKVARAQLILEGAHVLGPCTHAGACPMASPDWCHFSQRLPRSRDHLLAKGGRVPFEDERYSWLAVSHRRRSVLESRARVLAPPREGKPGSTLKLCDASGLSERFVARRDRDAFAALRRVGWGDVL